MSESWRVVWREFAKMFSTESLEELRTALQEDDPRLLQGATTQPPPLTVVQDWPVEKACAVSFCGWRDGLETVGEVEEFFARACYEVDSRLGEPAACRWFLNAYDGWPREEMRGQLLPEVERELEARNGAPHR